MDKRGSEESPKLFPIFQKNFRPKPPDPLQEMQMTLEKSQQQQQFKRRKNLLGQKETPGLTQMVLDAGQKVIGPVHCDECGLLYSPGDIEDEREHQKAHARLDNRFIIRLWKDAKILNDYPAEACLIVQLNCKTESKRALGVLKDFLTWLDTALGGAHDESGKPSETILLYIFRTRRKNVFRILGCVIVESIEHDKVIRCPITPNAESGSKENVRMIFGITRLWTEPSFRRKQIATRLVDAVRVSWAMPGFIVPKHQIGILEPSEDGKSFMNKYTNGAGWFYTYF